MNYNKLLLNELRFITYEKGNCTLTDELMVKAVTLNENLKSLGYVLSAKDIPILAVSPSLDGFYDKIYHLVDKFDAKPMYPGYPKQVIEIDEAIFRYHQLVHYFSTYGMESTFGIEVKHGWLPYENEYDENLSKQKIVLEAKTIKLLPKEDKYLTPIRMILSRKERMTLPEKEIIANAIVHISPLEISDINVGFKENLNTLYSIIFDMSDKDSSFAFLRSLCQHTGDVMRCVDVLLRKNKYHFHTSQKRFLVRLLESYSAKDFRTNLILSRKAAKRSILLLNFLDYSVYSKSKEHIEAVNDLRNGNLRSWESIAKSLLSSGDSEALDFIATRPGIMLRMVAWLLKLGYTPMEIINKLRDKASSLSMQTLVTNMNYFGKLTPDKRSDTYMLYYIFEELLSARMKSINTSFKGKKVMLKMDSFDLEASELRCNNKSKDGGFIRSGIAYRIPEEISTLRFFVYWNDINRVDVDLHTGYTDNQNRNHHVGWNQSFRDTGVVFSGDITHSNAAEYIDIDLEAPISKVHANIHLYSGKKDFSGIDTCYVGMMAVPNDEDMQNTALYSEANCFFKHHLRQKCSTLNYGYIDVKNRCLIFDGEAQSSNYNWYNGLEHQRGILTLARYLNLLIEAQNATICTDEEEADCILVMEKPKTEKEVSLIDSNFFLD